MRQGKITGKIVFGWFSFILGILGAMLLLLILIGAFVLKIEIDAGSEDPEMGMALAYVPMYIIWSIPFIILLIVGTKILKRNVWINKGKNA